MGRPKKNRGRPENLKSWRGAKESQLGNHFVQYILKGYTEDQCLESVVGFCWFMHNGLVVIEIGIVFFILY